MPGWTPLSLRGSCRGLGIILMCISLHRFYVSFCSAFAVFLGGHVQSIQFCSNVVYSMTMLLVLSARASCGWSFTQTSRPRIHWSQEATRAPLHESHICRMQYLWKSMEYVTFEWNWLYCNKSSANWIMCDYSYKYMRFTFWSKFSWHCNTTLRLDILTWQASPTMQHNPISLPNHGCWIMRWWSYFSLLNK